MGKSKRERKNLVLANGDAAKGYSTVGKDKDDKRSMPEKDDMLSKLREQNQGLITQARNLKEERGTGKKMEEHSDSAGQSKVTENYFHEHTEMIHKEVNSARRLLEMQNQRTEDFVAENARLKKQIEEKEEQRTKFESLREELARKYTELEEKHLESLKKNGENKKMILALKRENASLGNETSLFLHNLNEETKRSREISAKCLETDERVLYLESQSLELKTELESAKSAYDEVAVRLSKIKEDKNKLSNDSCHLKEEKETLHQNLMLQFSTNKELEENLLSTKSSLEELKDSASKGEQQIAMLQRQLLNVAVEKDDRIFDLQCELSAMVIRLTNLQGKLSSAAEEKMLLQEKQSEIERRKRVSEEEEVHLKGRIGELERALDFCRKDLESCRAMAVEKDCELADSEYQLSDLAQAKRCVQDENDSLKTELNKYKGALVSERQKLHLHLQADVHGNENAANSVQEDGITENGHVNPKPEAVLKPNNVEQQPKRGRGNKKSKK